jgi:hypothetical protein
MSLLLCYSSRGLLSEILLSKAGGDKQVYQTQPSLEVYCRKTLPYSISILYEIIERAIVYRYAQFPYGFRNSENEAGREPL